MRSICVSAPVGGIGGAGRVAVGAGENRLHAPTNSAASPKMSIQRNEG